MQAKRATFYVQAGYTGLGSAAIRNTLRTAGLMAGLGLLAGCQNSSSLNPVSWWHQSQGGKIAEDRPEPPGADQPYPNLNAVPGRPTPPNQEELNKLTSALVADRTNAQHEAQAAPLADPSSPQASPQLFGVGTAPPPGAAPPAPPAGAKAAAAAPPPPEAPPAASASMPAVTTPPAPPAPAPRRAVQSAPLEAPQAATPAAAASAPATPPSGAPASDADGVQPTLPSGPPPRPTVAGSPPPPVVAPPPMPEPKGAQNATIVFTEGSTSLSAPANEEVKAFAGKRGNGVIVVTGFGEAASGDPSAQTAAVNLGLSRAQAVAEALKASGVPGNAIRVSAEATGRGASLVLVQ